MKYLKLLILLFILIFVPDISSAGDTISGKVVAVADGDTITILTSDKKQVQIRFAGIDTPEKKQAYGQKAKDFTASKVAGKIVNIDIETTDKYGRTVGYAFADGSLRSVNEQIVASGFGWVYRKYCLEAFCSDWLRMEEKARESKIGLWADNDPTPPWEWRKAQRTNQEANIQSGTGIFHGNIKSHVFHGPKCDLYNCKACTVVFNSIQDAEKSGYRAHKDCVH